MKAKGQQTRSFPNYWEGGHCVSLDRGDQRITGLEGKLVKLEQKQKNLNSFYQNKIKQLSSIIQQQQSVKQGLIQQLSILSKQSLQLNNYIDSWRHQLSENIDLSNSNRHREFTSNPYDACSPTQKQQSKNKIMNKQHKGTLFQSSNLKNGLLKQSKSEKLIESQYWPRKNAADCTNLHKKNMQSCRLFG